MSWHNSYHFWISERGVPIKVKKIKYIGIHGWDNYIFRKEHDGKMYYGEIWLCEDIFGNQMKRIFREIYTDEVEEQKYSHNFKLSHKPGIPIVEINAHTDGYDAYITKDFKKRNRKLLEIQNIRLKNKIELLTNWFKILNNFENKLLKLGIQLYLRRLQTPTMQTSREWREYGSDHPYMKSLIIEKIKHEEKLVL